MKIYTLTKINSFDHELVYSKNYTNIKEAKLSMLNEYYSTLANWVFILHDNIDRIEHDTTDIGAWVEDEKSTLRIDWYIAESNINTTQE